jgi:hypothetical protein
VAGEQISSAANECKKMISLSKFFASGGEIREWKTGLTKEYNINGVQRLLVHVYNIEVYFRSALIGCY